MTVDLVLVGFSLLTWGMGEGMFIFFTPLYLQQLGANALTIGGILGAMGIAMTVAHIPAGYLADKLGRRPMLLFVWVLALGSGWIMALAPGLTVFVIGLLAYGLTACVISPLNSYVTGARGSFSPGRALTLTSAMYSVGAVAGPLIGGWVGSQYGLRMTYLAAAGVFVASTAILVFIHAQPRDHHDPDSPPANLLANRRYLGFSALVLIVMFATYLPQPLASVFLQNERGLSLGQIGQLGSLNNVGVVVFNLVLGQFDARVGFLVGQAAVAVFSVLLWKGTGMFWFAPAYFLLAGFRVTRPLIAAQVRELIHSSQMGLAYGITETIGAIPTILAPPIAGLLYDRDPSLIYPVSLVLITLGLLASLKYAPRSLAVPAMAETAPLLRDDTLP